MNVTEREHGLYALECVECNHWRSVKVSIAGVFAWRNGALVCKAMPELSAADREQFISGICPSCWDKMFNNEEE